MIPSEPDSPAAPADACGETVSLERRGPVAILTLERPERRNAVDGPTARALHAAVRAVDADDSLSVTVLQGRGGHFCAGADLKKTLADDPNLIDHLEEYIDAFHAVIRAIVRCDKPTIAMLDGCAVGFGGDMAFACDLRVASANAYIQEKFVKIGLMPDGGGTFWLPRLVGTARALKWMYLADKIRAEELEQLGLLSNLVPPDELRSAALNLARELEKGPPLAYARMKRAVYGNLGDIDAALAREREGQLALLRSKDGMEGILAWAQKREPVFTGE